ncbi:hypothetical protein N7490_007685 [Penicillium lividum]|nr:hypothetical protein N7490_007685 [Penicillium lividum]
MAIIGLVVEFVVAIDEARVRFTDDAYLFAFFDYPTFQALQSISHSFFYKLNYSIASILLKFT